MTKGPCGTGVGSAWRGRHGQAAPLGTPAPCQVLTGSCSGSTLSRWHPWRWLGAGLGSGVSGPLGSCIFSPAQTSVSFCRSCFIPLRSDSGARGTAVPSAPRRSRHAIPAARRQPRAPTRGDGTRGRGATGDPALAKRHRGRGRRGDGTRSSTRRVTALLPSPGTRALLSPRACSAPLRLATTFIYRRVLSFKQSKY